MEEEEEPVEEVAEEEKEPVEEEEEQYELENNANNQALQGLPNDDLLELWDKTVNFEERDRIIVELQRRNLFPSSFMNNWESQTGAYPDIIDPEFLQKLLAKREFAESLQSTWKPKSDPCEDNNTFEVTPVQRFVANFMSPKTPYMSALLFHGVGVGKTCAAVQIIEAWLEAFPNQQVYLIAPPTIQQGFFRTIFDISKVTIGKDNEPNTASQCTGVTYMKLTNTLYERDPERIQKAVNRMIRRRYDVYGYNSFANYVRDLLKGIPSGASIAEQQQYQKDIIRRIFSGKLLVVDEAHNLRDINDSNDIEEEVLPGGKAERGESSSGKQLTPYLKLVLQYSEGLKFCALTATPMYNTYREIRFILNLLLMNDKKAEIKESMLFDSRGNITEQGRELLGYISQRYISFMRGENPISFPVRLFPNVPTIESYPIENPSGVEIPEKDRDFYKNLPIVPIMLKGDALTATRAFMEDLPPSEKLSPFSLDKLVHAGNIIVPSLQEEKQNESLVTLKERTDKNALLRIFNKESVGGEIRYRAKEKDGARWLGIDQLGNYSPKFEFLLNRIRTAEGCIFAYTRFVNGGAVPLALALEANGYTLFGRQGLLANSIQTEGGRQCAMCPYREKNHANQNHTFVPAYYGILTGEQTISPDNEKTINAQRNFNNAEGKKMKIIIGSQVASEGVDLRFIRETHVIDSWFHLNKTEQILGRAIRFLSHCALPKEKRNNTVYLYSAVLPADDFNRETADLYSYRIGFKKALLIGNVTRIIKQAAMDCNLNRDAIIVRGQEPIRQIDSQRFVRDNVNINDMPFTAVCDWIETCEYKCKPTIDVKTLFIDDSTYDEFSARWHVNKMKERIRVIFKDQAFYSSEDVWNQFSDIPRLAVVDLLTEIVDNKNFQIENNGLKGYIRYCNGYYLFQPNVYTDLTIPLAIRTASFPVKRDVFEPVEFEIPAIVEEKKQEEDIESVHEFWEAMQLWVQRLSTSPNVIKSPRELEQRIIDMSQGNKDIEDARNQNMDAILWFHHSFHKSASKNPESFRKAILCYFWDEWLTLEEQKYLVFSSGLNVEDCIRNSQYILRRRNGDIIVNRFMNPDTDGVEYMCEGKKTCE